MTDVVIAYEPAWAIGTGRTASPEQAQEAHAFIRGVLAELYEKKLAEAIRILYGGSVKPENIDSLMAEPDTVATCVASSGLHQRIRVTLTRVGLIGRFGDRLFSAEDVGVGKPAPDFEANAFVGEGFKPIKLSDYKGKWIVVCFYPGDFTFV
mgnify:CR=1 FL=1